MNPSLRLFEILFCQTLIPDPDFPGPNPLGGSSFMWLQPVVGKASGEVTDMGV
jgi:hypothetical protein